MQICNKPVDKIKMGDRVSIAFKYFDAETLRRSFAALPFTLSNCDVVIAMVRKWPGYSPRVRSKEKYKIFIGH